MKNIVLIGMMGCGKSTCGRQLAKKLHRNFVDTDQWIEDEAGCTISQIFAEKGESHFRKLETALARKLSNQLDMVIATGGGMVVAEENRQLLQRNSVVVFLNRSVDEIFDTADMANRPLAQQGKADFLERFAQREPIYRQTCHIEVTDFTSSEHTITSILQQLEGKL